MNNACDASLKGSSAPNQEERQDMWKDIKVQMDKLTPEDIPHNGVEVWATPLDTAVV